MPDQTEIPVSSFPDAQSINGGDKVTGLQNNSNTNFTFSSIMSWLVNAFRAVFVPVTRTVNGKTLDTNITLNASDVGARPSTWTPSVTDIGAQPVITASGILMGDGVGGVAAATAGTDYATPSQIPSVPSAYTSNPAMDGTASPGSSGAWAKGDHVHPSDTSRIPTTEKGAANGVASLDSTGKVPSSQLPAIPTTAAGVSYDNTASGLTADDVQEAIDELAAGAGGSTAATTSYDNTDSGLAATNAQDAIDELADEKADQTTIAPVEASTTATEAHSLGSTFYLEGVLYRALSDIAIGGTINTAAGGNATQTKISENFKRTVTLTAAQYAQLSAAEKAADIVYIITDDNAISADDVDYNNTASGLTATNVQDAIDEVYGDIPSQPSDIGAQDTITASGILKGDGAGGVSAATPGTDYQAPLTIDAAPTANSTNPVQSGGVYTDVRTRVPNYGKGKNLLRNWYFVGGGTGRGVFPVNQRGQSSYNGVSYSVDGWYIRNTHALVELTSSGLKLKKNIVNYGDWGQYLSQETLNILSGKTVTLSWLDDVDCKSVTFTWTSNSTPVLVYSVGGLNIYAGVNYPNAYNLLFQTTAIEKTFKAVKLELGSEQTLAHQENGVWVLNEIPDYEEELIKCQTSTADSSDTYANKSLATRQDLTSIQATGTTNTTGAAIPAGAYFYLNGVLCKAKVQIDQNATFTVNTNCEQVTVGSILTGISVSASAIDMPGIAISRVRSGIVFLNVYDFKPSSASGTISGTLPQELRPIQTTSGPVLSADGTKSARISISTQGVVTYTGVDTNKYYYGLISYPAAI